MIYLIGFFIVAYFAMCHWPRLWCRIGLHHWDQPGGECRDCGKHDDFFDQDWYV